MKIAVNTRLLLKNNLDGIGRFTLEILKRVVIDNPKINFHFIFDRPFSSTFIFAKNITTHILSPPTRHPLLWYIWFEHQLPRLINKIKPDLFLSPDGFMSTKLSIPSIIVIHDINFEHRPQDLAWTHSLFYRHYFKKYAKLAQKIITVSEYSKKDIMDTYKIKEKKINVIYNGVSNVFKEINEIEKLRIKKKYSEEKDFFLFIGSLHKRKNIKNLLLAFDLYRNNQGENKLLVIGRKKWWDQKTETIYQNMSFKDEVVFLGQLNDNEMSLILGSAKALCFISIFEGFGLPIIEAMKCCVPVITSNTSSMPEIAKDAALIVNPYNIKEIQNAMIEIDINHKLRDMLIKKGQKRIKIFDWEIAAKRLSNILNDTTI